MIRAQFSLDERLLNDARKEARRLGISFAELCRRALAQMLAARDLKHPWMRYAGALESGDPQASRSVDEIV
jgi:hypothetical protein